MRIYLYHLYRVYTSFIWKGVIMGFVIVYGGMGTLAFVLGLVLLVIALTECRLVKPVQNTPTSLLRNVEDGFIERNTEVMKSATMPTAPKDIHL